MDTLNYLISRANELEIKIDYPGKTDGTQKAVVVICASLNVRSGPSIAAPIVDHIKRGDVVTIMDHIDYWAKIGESRWVSSLYLDEVSQP